LRVREEILDERFVELGEVRHVEIEEVLQPGALLRGHLRERSDRAQQGTCSAVKITVSSTRHRIRRDPPISMVFPVAARVNREDAPQSPPASRHSKRAGGDVAPHEDRGPRAPV
jgi:hypothetical protein